MDRTLLRDHKTQTVNFVGDSSSIYTHFRWHFWEQSLFIIDLNVGSVHFLFSLIPFFCQQLRALCYLHRFCDGKNHIEVILERCDLYENHMIQFQWKNQPVVKRQWFESFPLKRLMPNCRWRMSSLYSFSLCFTDYVFFALSMNWNLRCGKLVKFFFVADFDILNTMDFDWFDCACSAYGIWFSGSFYLGCISRTNRGRRGHMFERNACFETLRTQKDDIIFENLIIGLLVIKNRYVVKKCIEFHSIRFNFRKMRFKISYLLTQKKKFKCLLCFENISMFFTIESKFQADKISLSWFFPLIC